MAGLRLHHFQVQALLEILTVNDLDIEFLPPDGILCFTYRLVLKLVKDCLSKNKKDQLTSEYLTDLRHNIRTLLHQAEKRSQIEDLDYIKDLADIVLSVLERPARSSERPDLIRSLIPARKPRMSDYETSLLIGTGAFGSIHLVRHKESQQIFAMKKMAKRNLDTPQKIELAFIERDILTFADCPFVVSMLCSFQSKSHLCMVMEYVGGGDCWTLLRIGGHFSVQLARLYFAEAVLGVEYLHSYGVVHRDLKPDNLLITSAGHIKITDFGLSKLGVMMPHTNIYKQSAENISREFLDEEVYGTPCYIAPEVILMKGYGRPLDWWSMGIILYEFLMGYKPFDGNSSTETYKNVLNGDITWDPYNTPPPDAQHLITQLLRKNPVDRLGTGGAFEIKGHAFLRDLDFGNLLSQKPFYVPQHTLDVDSSLFINHSDINKYLDSEDEESTREDNELFDFQNYASSSERLSKLYTTTNGMMNNEDPKSPPECTPTSNADNSEMQYESVPVSDRDDAIILPSSSPLSDHSDIDKHLVLEYEEDPKSPPECAPNSSTNICEMQNESVPASDRDDAIIILPSSSPLSDHSDINKHLDSEDEEDPKSPPECAPNSSTNICKMRKESVPVSDSGSTITILPSSSQLPDHSDINKHLDSEDEEDPKSPPECASNSSTNVSEKQKESVLVFDRDDVITILPSSSPVSEFPAQMERKNSPINLSKEETSENGEKQKERRGSIFRRILSSCRRGLSRAARVFAGCHCCPRTS